MQLVRHTAGAKLLGIYLHGSGAQGGLKPASDVDVMVVTAESLSDTERAALTQGLLAARGERPVELTVVVQGDVRPWRYPPMSDFLYGEWLRAEFEAGGVPRREHMPGLAIMIMQTVQADHALTGPPPREVLDDVPRADLVRASLDEIAGLLEDLRGDERNVVLTLARIWVTVATGEVMSKEAAADWALARLEPEHRPVLEHAKHLYLTTRYRDETWRDELKAQVRAHVEAVLERIVSASRAAS